MKYKNLIDQMTLEEKVSLMSGKDFWQTVNIDRLGIPSIFLSDGPHGLRKQAASADHLGLNPSIPATCFPPAATMANSWNPELGKGIEERVGHEAVFNDVSIVLGPGTNIKRNPLCGRNFEYFSEDPYLSGKMSVAYIQGVQENGISGCIKHFACNNQEERRMSYDSIVDERALREIYLTSFEMAVKEGHTKSLMTSYNKLNGQYTNENEHLLVDILRKEWGYQGFIVTDWGGCNDRVAGIKATNALEMPSSGGESGKEIMKALKNGTLDENTLNERVDELLTIVFDTTKAFENKKPFDKEEHHAYAEKCAEESMVLLKNDGTLPLKPTDKVAIIGDFAKTPRYQGAGSSIVNPTKVDSLIGLSKDFKFKFIGFEPGFNRYGKKSTALMKKAVELAKKADTLVVFIGLDEVSEAEGLDRPNMKLPENQLALIEELKKLNKKMVILLACGSAVEMPFDDKKINSILHTYLPGQAGAGAIVKILNGDVNPSGKLAETYPIKYEDVPSSFNFPCHDEFIDYKESIFVGYRYFDTKGVKVKYPFGYGLSYTTFQYDNLKISKDGIKFTIKNTGSVTGKEIAQMYVSLPGSVILRPNKELKGFTKVELKPGEEKEVTIPFDDKTFRYFNTVTNKFEIEDGDYLISVGASLEDIRLQGIIHVDGTTDNLPYDKSEFPGYLALDIKAIPDQEFEKLLGRNIKPNIIKGKKHRQTVDYNTTVMELRYSRGWTGRFFAGALRFAYNFLNFFGQHSTANTLVMGVFHQPMRNLSKMGGIMSMGQLDGLIIMFNGKFFKGLNHFFKAGKVRKQEKKAAKKKAEPENK